MGRVLHGHWGLLVAVDQVDIAGGVGPFVVAENQPLLLRPLLCAVQNAVDFNDILADAVNSQKGQGRKHQFAGVQLAARTAAVGKLREGTYASIDCECHTPSRCRALTLLDVIADVCEVAGSGLCPANAH